MKQFRPILILFFVASAEPCGAGVITQNKGGASLEIKFDREKPNLALADLITVTLTIEGSPSLQTPVAPLELPTAAPWLLVERSKLRVTDLKDPPRRRYQLVYRFAPRQPGAKIPFQFPAVKFREADGEEQTVTWTPIEFTVETQIVQPDSAPLRDITAIETLPPVAPPDRTWQWWSAMAALALLLVAAILLTRILLRRRGARSPAQLALYEWQRLVAMKLPEKGHSERFITLLTTLVRRYLERQFAVPARRQTTPEFIHGLANLALVTSQEKLFLAAFLQRCEAVKFAQEVMTAEECDRWAKSTREFLQTRSAAPLQSSAETVSGERLP